MSFTQDYNRSAIGRFETEGACEVVRGWLTPLDEVADRLFNRREPLALLYYADDAITELAIALASRSADSAELAPMRRCWDLNGKSLISARKKAEKC